MISALYAGGYGMFIGLRHATDGAPPINWTGFSLTAQLELGAFLVAAALAHGLGVRVNGSWRWSPVLRLWGMATHSALFAALTIAGAASTAGYTYAWATGFLAFGAWNAARDSIDAWRGEEPLWKAN